MEVLLALGLTVLLLGMVSAALMVYARSSTSGREAVEHAQIARAVLRLIERDLTSVVFRKPQSEESAAETEAAEEESAEMTIEITDPGEAYANGSLGVFGDAQTLVLHISRPLRELNYSPLLEGASVQTRSSDLQSVAYFLAVEGGQGLQGAVGRAQAERETTEAGNSTIRGLARLEGDRLAMNRADAALDLQALTAQTAILAPEVQSLAFRYFDGLGWLDSWDSLTAGRLPQAVEVNLGLSSDDGSSAPRVYRYVVALPLSDPVPPAEGL